MDIRTETTKSVYFAGTTEAGRKMRIEVIAAADIEDVAILNDLKRSDFQRCELDKECLLSLGFALLIFTVIMIGVFGIGLLARMIVEGAAWVPHYSSWRWPSVLPVVGDFDFWMGIVRVWSLFWPIGFISIPIIFKISSRRRNKRVST